MTLALIVAANVLSGVIAVWMAMAIISFGARFRESLIARLVDFAIGTLLGSAFLGLLPAAVEAQPRGGPHAILLTVLLGILGFLALERVVAWRHCHVAGCPRHDRKRGHAHVSIPIVLLGDGLHNLIDGVVIASAFVSSRQAGITATLAVLMHELPQEMGDFGVLLRAGLSSRRALAYNTLGATTAIAGGVAAYFALEVLEATKPYVLAFSAASFIYLALADLVPSLHDAAMTGRRTAAQLALIVAGVVAVVGSHWFVAHVI
jgi:zinc and cadmium transporter